MSQDLIVALSKRYIAVFEKITGKKFSAFPYPIEERIKKNIVKFLKKYEKKNHLCFSR